jgi:hypothetical protein
MARITEDTVFVLVYELSFSDARDIVTRLLPVFCRPDFKVDPSVARLPAERFAGAFAYETGKEGAATKKSIEISFKFDLSEKRLWFWATPTAARAYAGVPNKGKLSAMQSIQLMGEVAGIGLHNEARCGIRWPAIEAMNRIMFKLSTFTGCDPVIAGGWNGAIPQNAG